MTWIVNRCPFFDKETQVAVPEGTILVRPYQMVVWVSLRFREAESRPFPAVFDTGHSHNFSLGTEHLEEWAGVKKVDVLRIGAAKVNERPIALVRATLLLHRNVRGFRDELRGDPWPLEFSEGIALYERGDPFTPRLPLLGLRAIVKSGLRAVTDGAKCELSIGKPWIW
jgi:hypothetical protein